MTEKNKKHYSIVPFGTGTEIEYTAAPALDYAGLSFNEMYSCFEPPVNRFALAKLPSQNAQHCGVINSRANMIAGGYLSGGLSKLEMRALCLNLIMFGDAGILKIRNGFGKVVRLQVLSSLYLRKKKKEGYRYLMRKSLYDIENNQVYDYKESDIIFIKLYDPQQQIYGVPDYLGGIQSALLNSDATIFRRRYYSNGAHMGFILYTNDPDMSEEAEEEIAKNLKNSKGVGNFRSMFVNIPGGDPDGVKVIPIGDTGKKDEFGNIKNISAQDVLTAHRFPPGLSGIIPTMGSFGDPIKMREAYQEDEVLPLQEMICEEVNKDSDLSGDLKLIFKKKEIKNKEK
ncbi:phage portal protein [Pasteurella skyensis]|uniref:Phage portal protein n=1 Tax=Phocoenobacter skyensis TaxID=97481 RepID=A0AAJ6P1F9_9PAST|nr:phage portal protein [Pasteurella skyensis]MDP8173669.1 phage portal protein [Pasteurella skyensis]MDP8178037.1 phage portal protein [Pasteurella skyensis]